MRHINIIVVAAALALPVVIGCESAPRVRPVKGGPVETGPESIESVRRQLQGTWDLTSLELVSPTGEKTAAQATGRLTYDEFGNLAMQGTVTGGANLDPSALNLTGRVTIDPGTHTLRFGSITAPNNDAKRVDPQLDAAHVRYYEFVDGLLKTTVKTADGRTTATATWKRIN